MITNTDFSRDLNPYTFLIEPILIDRVTRSHESETQPHVFAYPPQPRKESKMARILHTGSEMPF